MKKSTTYWTIIFHKIAQRLVEKYEIIMSGNIKYSGYDEKQTLGKVYTGKSMAHVHNIYWNKKQKNTDAP